MGCNCGGKKSFTKSATAASTSSTKTSSATPVSSTTTKKAGIIETAYRRGA